jgi:hypothetical protein
VSEAVIVESVPSAATSYDDAALAGASDTYSRPSGPNWNPNGVAPLKACTFGPLARPFGPMT